MPDGLWRTFQLYINKIAPTFFQVEATPNTFRKAINRV